MLTLAFREIDVIKFYSGPIGVILFDSAIWVLDCMFLGAVDVDFLTVLTP